LRLPLWVKSGGTGLTRRPSGLPSIADIPPRRREHRPAIMPRCPSQCVAAKTFHNMVLYSPAILSCCRLTTRRSHLATCRRSRSRLSVAVDMSAAVYTGHRYAPYPFRRPDRGCLVAAILSAALLMRRPRRWRPFAPGHEARLLGEANKPLHARSGYRHAALHPAASGGGHTPGGSRHFLCAATRPSTLWSSVVAIGGPFRIHVKLV
jgi:hypothetical protein